MPQAPHGQTWNTLGLSEVLQTSLSDIAEHAEVTLQRSLRLLEALPEQMEISQGRAPQPGARAMAQEAADRDSKMRAETEQLRKNLSAAVSYNEGPVMAISRHLQRTLVFNLYRWEPRNMPLCTIL
eukprot:s2570_g9.t1